jgi:hypothetical protein
MSTPTHISLWAASRQLGGYPKLLINLAEQNGLRIVDRGRGRYIDQGDLARLGDFVRAWINRPRMSLRKGR